MSGAPADAAPDAPDATGASDAGGAAREVGVARATRVEAGFAELLHEYRHPISGALRVVVLRAHHPEPARLVRLDEVRRAAAGASADAPPFVLAFANPRPDPRGDAFWHVDMLDFRPAR